MNNQLSIQNLISVETVIKPIYKFKFIDVTIWHYALLLSFEDNSSYGDDINIIVNFGPTVPFINNRALIRFEKFHPRKWRAPRSYFWMRNSTDSKSVDKEAVIKRLLSILTHIEETGHYSNGKLKINPFKPGQKYDWNEYNCEHFCSYIMYGSKNSSQYDGFDDGPD